MGGRKRMEKEKKENKEGCYGRMKLCFLCEWLWRGFGFRTMMELWVCVSWILWYGKDDGLFGDGGKKCHLVDEAKIDGKEMLGRLVAWEEREQWTNDGRHDIDLEAKWK